MSDNVSVVSVDDGTEALSPKHAKHEAFLSEPLDMLNDEGTDLGRLIIAALADGGDDIMGANADFDGAHWHAREPQR